VPKSRNGYDRRVMRMVRTDWAAIDAIAKALVRRRFLNSFDFERIMRRVDKRETDSGYFSRLRRVVDFAEWPRDARGAGTDFQSASSNCSGLSSAPMTMPRSCRTRRTGSKGLGKRAKPLRPASLEVGQTRALEHVRPLARAHRAIGTGTAREAIGGRARRSPVLPRKSRPVVTLRSH
jgi:hypothetical protein